MKIMICGSMTFVQQMMNTKRKLEKLGHFISVPEDIKFHIDNHGLIDDFDADYKHAVENNVLRKCFDLLAKSDAILVLNHDKNGIKGYVGTSSLMEIGIAYYLGKKIFLLNPLPDSRNHHWVHEVKIMQPVIINGELERIK